MRVLAFPAVASINGATSSLDEPETAEPTAPKPHEPAAPFPGEPGDMPAVQPAVDPKVPTTPSYDPPAERSIPRFEPEPVAKVQAQQDHLLADLDRLISRSITSANTNMRLSLAVCALMMGMESHINHMQSAVRRLEPEDWRDFADVAQSMRRSLQELDALLAPACTPGAAQVSTH